MVIKNITMTSLKKITPNLWFDDQAEEAVNYYLSIFKNSRILRVCHYGEEGQEIHKMPAGSIMTIEFEIEGQSFIALNGGPVFHFTEAISFVVDCQTQEDIDYYWERLTPGGDPASQQCGWLKDKYGVSWQIVPTLLNNLIADQNTPQSARAMRAMLGMKKLNIEALQKAYDG
jgi:predicted 3-demethylubiquinone-9 3-methyltransferase (glyoxalase superfamily)